MKKLTFLAAIVAAGISALAFAPAQAETAADAKLDEIKTASIAKPGQQFASIISRHAKEHGVPVALAHAVIQVESSYRPDVRGSAGEIGLMQIKPATARLMGYKGSDKGLYDPETNIRYGMKYLGKARALSDGSTCGTILKYNAGHGAKRMNPVSRNYCNKVEKILAIGS